MRYIENKIGFFVSFDFRIVFYQLSISGSRCTTIATWEIRVGPLSYSSIHTDKTYIFIAHKKLHSFGLINKCMTDSVNIFNQIIFESICLHDTFLLNTILCRRRKVKHVKFKMLGSKCAICTCKQTTSFQFI